MDDKKRILIVDDESAIRDVMSKILETVGYEALAAATGEEGIGYTREHNPDAIITDFNYKTPGMNGILFARHVRRDGYDKPIIIAASDVHAICREYGDAASLFNGYLDKPFRSGNLLAELARVLNDHRSQ